jgi:hypothetical protein
VEQPAWLHQPQTLQITITAENIPPKKKVYENGCPDLKIISFNK